MEHTNHNIALTVNRMTYRYRTRGATENAVDDVSFEFEYGKVYAIVGKSGCGKTTLISNMAGLDLPTAGDVIFEGESTRVMDRYDYRRENVAVIYQNYNLFPILTVKENVLYPMQLKNVPKKERERIACEKLEEMGLGRSYWRRFPSMLSGGEQQRVAIARALAGGQRILLADEPTGNLDAENSAIVMNTFRKLAHEDGYCVIIVTHDPQIAEESDCIVRMSSGKIVGAEEAMHA